MANDEITSVRIHPAIGISRVGNSDRHFIGPETTGPFPRPDGGYKHQGRLKRQAARFRLYGYNAGGKVIRELTAADPGVQVEWTVELANKKAAWYCFDRPLDIPESEKVRSARRNASFRGAARQDLVIRPRPGILRGDSTAPVRFDDGKFLGTSVYLGELRMDKGRLLVLGGNGVADTPLAHNSISEFANNNGWYDDTSDGPVRASVRINGRKYEADPAWVVIAPPNYAPEIVPVQTMYELIESILCGQLIPQPPTVSFQRDILPLLRNLSNTQWVNYGFHVLFGPGAPYDFFQSGLIQRLASNASQDEGIRRHVFRFFRDPDGSVADAFQWPAIYGDAFGDVDDSDARAGMAIAANRYECLRQWAAGAFESDYEKEEPPSGLEEVDLQEQPKMLDRAALHFCMGGPFHPGCELTWPMRHLSLYRSPFRIRMRPADQPEIDYGDFMSPEIALAPDGPLSGSGPGDLTRWMALPWQTDTASCLAAYPNANNEVPDPFLPAFWPARVPNHVLTEADYDRILSNKDPQEKRAAFNRRHAWLRRLHGDSPYLTQISRMIEIFGELGIVERRKGPANTPGIPKVLYVETSVTRSEPAPHAPPHIAATPPGAPGFREARFGGRRRQY